MIKYYIVFALGNVTEYTYDGAGQITTVTQKGKDGEDITISYAYDNLGNITSVTDGEGNTFRMTYDKVENVTAIYDAYGQLAERYTYDSVYNQTSVTDGKGAKMLYSYDRMGNKIKELNESNGSVTTYSHIGGSLISASTDAFGGNTSATYDAMGNLESFTNPNGGVTTYTYNIFGKLLSGNYGELEFLYNGQYGVASDANGLYYMRARYYNIDIMRFINQDILTGSIDRSQSLNRYAYVEGNPVNFLDPFGLDESLYDELHKKVLSFNFWISTLAVSLGWVNVTLIGNAISIALVLRYSVSFFRFSQIPLTRRSSM